MPKAPKKDERSVVYPDVEVNGVKIPRENLRVTAAQVEQILGVEYETDSVKFGEDYSHIDRLGRKVRLNHNVSNRPFDESLAKAWMTEILKRHWRLNGETMIVGQYGSAISLQHRGVGLLWAVQEWSGGKNAEHWKKIWPEEPYLNSLIVYGIEETDDVINTVDTGKPRSAADAIYRSEIFADQKSKDRRIMSRMLEHAVKLLWDRTGAKHDAYTPRRTHAEAFDFIYRHPRLIKAVKHIHGENADGVVARYFSPGYASGLTYLFAASASDGDKYRSADPPSEKTLDFGKSAAVWEKACEFWVGLCSSKDFEAVRTALGNASNPVTGLGGTFEERLAILILAWKEFSTGGAMTVKNVTPKYDEVTDDDGNVVRAGLEGEYILPGIDTGGRKLNEEEDPELTEEQVEENKAHAKAEKNGQIANMEEYFSDLRSGMKDKTLLLKQPDGTHEMWDVQAEQAAKVLEGLDLKLTKRQKMSVLTIPADEKKLLDCCSLLRVAGHKLLVVTHHPDGGDSFSEAPSRSKPAHKPEPTSEPTTGPTSKPAKPAQKPKKKPALRGGTTN